MDYVKLFYLANAARQAYRFYILATDAELQELNMTREDALGRAYEADETAREAQGLSAGSREPMYNKV